MSMDDKNPCDCCGAKDKASGCNCCVLHVILTHGECQNDSCMVNYECGCLLSLDDICKASTCYQDDYRDHDCADCVHFGEGKFGTTYCKKDEHEISRWDTACEDFEESGGEE